MSARLDHPAASASYRSRSQQLAEHWYVACTSRELPADRPIARTIMDTRLALFRGADGTPVALPDRCLHRNAQLSEGAVFDGCIGCPYHGWTYDAEGRCVQIPSEGPQVSARPGKTLQPFPAREQDGLVWVFMGTEPPPAAPLPMPFFRGDGWASYYMVTPFENTVTNLVENFMDVPHTIFVHAGWFRNPKRREGEAIVRLKPGEVEVEYLHQDGIGFADWALNPEGLPMTHFDRFYAPNVTRVDYAFGTARRFVISSAITPVTEDTCMVYTAIAFRFGWLTPLLKPFFGWYTRQVIEQDVRIMANQVVNLRAEPAAFMSTEADLVHDAIESVRVHAEHGGEPPEPFERRIRFWI